MAPPLWWADAVVAGRGARGGEAPPGEIVQNTELTHSS